MSGINSVVLIGRLTADPEARKTSGGLSVCHFTLAVDRRVTKDEEKKADFIRCVAWRQSADYLTQYASKGRLIGITGHIRTGSYADKDTGKTIYTTDIDCDSVTLLDSRKDTQASTNPSPDAPVAAPAYRTAYENSIANGFTPDEDNSLPW